MPSKEYREKNREKLKIYARKYYCKNKDKILRKKREDYVYDPESKRIENQKAYQRNKEKIKKQTREYYNNNKEYYKEYYKNKKIVKK